MDGWMDVWMDSLSNGWIDCVSDGWIDERVYQLVDGWND